MNRFIVPCCNLRSHPPSPLLNPSDCESLAMPVGSKDTLAHSFSHSEVSEEPLLLSTCLWHIDPIGLSIFLKVSSVPRKPKLWHNRGLQVLRPHPVPINRFEEAEREIMTFNHIFGSKCSDHHNHVKLFFPLFLTGVFSHLEHRSSSCPVFC